MSDTFFHLLGPGTQPDDDSFSMNPLPLTCQVNSDPSMASLENCPHSPAVMALLADVRHQLTQTVANRIIEVTDTGIIDRMCSYDEYMHISDLESGIRE